jgi:hypothetical protein
MANYIYGKWKLNDDLEYLHARVPVNFTSNGFKYCYMHIGYNSEIISFVRAPYSEDNSLLVDLDHTIYFNNHYHPGSSPYRIIDFGTAYQEVSSDFKYWLSTNATFLGQGTWEAVYQLSASERAWQLREAYKYLNNEWVKISPLFNTYKVTAVISGIEDILHVLNSSIAEDSVIEYLLTAEEGRMLPEKVTVENAEILEWDNTTGKLVISKPVGDVVITAEAVIEPENPDSTEPEIPVDPEPEPTGITWSVPMAWAVNANYGIFKVSGTVVCGNSDGSFNTIYMGYATDFQAYRNSIAFYTDSDMEYHVGNSSSFTITLTGGTDINNENLLSWLDRYGERV